LGKIGERFAELKTGKPDQTAERPEGGVSSFAAAERNIATFAGSLTPGNDSTPLATSTA
jgi:hypothetical protein